MYRFFNDYSEGAHPRVLALLAQTNLDQEEGYGTDSLSLRAEGLIKGAIENPGAAVHFASGGTQTNLIALAAMLKPFESVIAAASAHINVHEAGAIEATGHKIHTLPPEDGKLTPERIQATVDQHTDEHMVKPRVVFISNSTEMGTAYRRAELEAIARVCRANGLYLYMDGARLGSALASRESDLTLPEIARWVDVFYIGGTKNGALLGEAIVIVNPALQPDFRFHLKQRGALLAKGRLMGAQFVALFSDGLFLDLARHANGMAERLTAGIRGLGFSLSNASTTNQIFPIFPNALIARLSERYGFYVWGPAGPDASSVRLVTSWATPEAQVAAFLSDLGGP